MNLDYLAGLMDADGHFTWRGGRYQAPDLGVTNTSAALMLALTDTFGGSAAIQRATCDEDCAGGDGHIHRRTDIWKWHITGYRAVLLCEALVPRLVIKADQAALLARQYREALTAMERPKRREHHMREEQAWWDEKGWD
jgi:hypothetical protein